MSTAGLLETDTPLLRSLPSLPLFLHYTLTLVQASFRFALRGDPSSPVFIETSSKTGLLLFPPLSYVSLTHALQVVAN